MFSPQIFIDDEEVKVEGRNSSLVLMLERQLKKMKVKEENYQKKKKKASCCHPSPISFGISADWWNVLAHRWGQFFINEWIKSKKILKKDREREIYEIQNSEQMLVYVWQSILSYYLLQNCRGGTWWCREIDTFKSLGFFFCHLPMIWSIMRDKRWQKAICFAFFFLIYRPRLI